MKTNVSLLTILCLLCLFAATGCKSPDGSGSVLFNTSTNSIESKAAIITQIAVTKVLQKHPNATPKLQIAADDLQILANAPTITVEPILEIINRLPPDTFSDPTTGLYIQAGVLFFADELGAVAAKNPDQLRAAARGMQRGVQAVISK